MLGAERKVHNFHAVHMHTLLSSTVARASAEVCGWYCYQSCAPQDGCNEPA
jgi:hypothetical protein